MTATVWGVVREGRVVPNSPLPEGAYVEIRIANQPAEVPGDLLAELEAWDRGSANAIELVERLIREGEDS